MYLRKLKLEDAPLMLEWMHDKEVVGHLHTDFSTKTLQDAQAFILASHTDTNNLNLAIASDEDVYMGTVSLKHIENGRAEFAITVRAAAMKRGYAWFAMQAILEKGFKEFGLEQVYWCVSVDNARAIRFYDKHYFHEALDIPEDIRQRYRDLPNLKWYVALKGDNLSVKNNVVGCRIIHIKTIPTVNAGELSFFETSKDISFDIKRIYYISKVPEGTRRGFHAHKTLKQVLFCPYGTIQLILENELGREEFELSDPSVGVLIEKPTWREMLWIQKDSVLCVGASDFYNTQDYIRDYEEFKRYIAKNAV